MKLMVTGAAGFIGSHLSERLVRDGHDVLGVDSFLDYYPREIKENNVSGLLGNPRFTFIEGDLLRLNLGDALNGVEAVFHQAAIPGVRHSWGERFAQYVDNNVLATQCLLEACKDADITRFIYASSSSVYGDAESLPVTEDSPTRPISPYGVSKLAGENLVRLYYVNYGVPTVSLRYFTIYGPRQRPDMGFHRFILSVERGEEIPVYGDGGQTRDFTFIDDAVEANVAALVRGGAGEVYNIGGGNRIGLKSAISLIEDVVGKSAKVVYVEPQKGDARDTFADVGKAGEGLGYKPATRIEEGLRLQRQWIRNHLELYS